ncbi:MAG: ABC transporter substrate-binding protein [Candidatus Thorarchaeota archaeon]
MVSHRRSVAATLTAVFIFMIFSPRLPVDALEVPSDINVGPYVDKVILKVIKNQDQKITALLSGEVDFIAEWVDPNYIPMLEERPDISMFSTLRNGYGHITINCRKYPLNISGFRKAFAYAFDKTRVRIDVLGGLSREQDSLVPFVSDWCIEDQLPYHYYSAQPEIGNQILDDLDFNVNPATGFRTAPDGSPFNVEIEYYALSSIAAATAQIGVDALRSIFVNANTRPAGIEVLSRLDDHGDYDMIMYASNFVTKDVDWLASEYYSENADITFLNPCNFANKTYDSWCSCLRHSTTFSEAFEVAAAMQLILHENVPRLVVYENFYTQCYRNDVFTGHVADMGKYLAGPWTLRKIHKIDGTAGGTVAVAFEDVMSFNVFLGGGLTKWHLWPQLYSLDPNLDPWPYLAKSMVMETHTDNPSVVEGHTRFTVDIIQNATWSDGTPLTGEDVTFTFTYYFESGMFGNIASAIMGELVAAYSPTTHRAIIEFGSESMWPFSHFAYVTIIPKHIFNDVDGIGFDRWNAWNPVFDPSEPFVTSGPFVLTDYEIGEFYEISANPNFCYYPKNHTTSSVEPSSFAETTFNTSLAIAAGAVGAAVTILVGGFYLFRRED